MSTLKVALLQHIESWGEAFRHPGCDRFQAGPAVQPHFILPDAPR